MTMTFTDCLQVARGELLIAKQLLDREIADYPSPKSACDQQYNHLLAERRRVTRLLQEFSADLHVPTPREP